MPIFAKPFPIRPLSRAEVRSIDERAIDEYGMTGAMLMENAGRGCAELLLELGCEGPVTIVCGSGNNAGDGFVIARHLDLQGVPVRIVMLAAPASLRGDAALNWKCVEKSGLPFSDFSGGFKGERLASIITGSEWLVDAILGTGARGAPRPPWDEAIRVMNRSPAKRLAVDLPSGLDCDTGVPSDATVAADHTATFVAWKQGFLQPSARPLIGQVHVVSIGAPRKLLEAVAGSS